MNLAEKIERSKHPIQIDFTNIPCSNDDDPLVKVVSSDKIRIEPIWEVDGDLEGQLYAEYRTNHPSYDGIYLRSDVLQRLQAAANSLDAQYQLVVHAGHRPLDVQRRLLRKMMADFKNENPHVSDAKALEHARTYVCDPDVWRPPHCCGAAVDIGLYDRNLNADVDFGSRVNLDAEISYLHATDISPASRANRQLLLRTMLNAGFASYYAEWWHFSYGDQIWAWFYGKSSCLYGITDADAQALNTPK